MFASFPCIVNHFEGSSLLIYEACSYRYRDGIELDSSDRLKISSPDSKTHTLTLNCIEEDDLGVYECKATSKAGVLSSKAKLIITGKIERPFVICHTNWLLETGFQVFFSRISSVLEPLYLILIKPYISIYVY